MTIGQVIKLKSMPTESWEVIEVRGDQACVRNTEEPRMAIWARENEIMQEEMPDKNKLIRGFIDGSGSCASLWGKMA